MDSRSVPIRSAEIADYTVRVRPEEPDQREWATVGALRKETVL